MHNVADVLDTLVRGNLAAWGVSETVCTATPGGREGFKMISRPGMAQRTDTKGQILTTLPAPGLQARDPGGNTRE